MSSALPTSVKCLADKRGDHTSQFACIKITRKGHDKYSLPLSLSFQIGIFPHVKIFYKGPACFFPSLPESSMWSKTEDGVSDSE